MPRHLARVASVMLLALAPARAAADDTPGPAGRTVTFPYQQARYVRDANDPGGLAYVPVGATGDQPRPVVLFLHGMNAYGEMHMGVHKPSRDLRLVVDALVASGRIPPVVLAAPSHTKGAYAGWRMWPDFDPRDFLDQTERALAGVHLDRTKLVVVGHSGAGCNPDGGILGDHVAKARPLAVLAVDTCLKAPLLPAYVALSAAVPLRFYWQAAWPRPLIPDLESSCHDCVVEEITGLPVKTAHSAILPLALERALPDLLGTPATPAPSGGAADEGDAHDAHDDG